MDRASFKGMLAPILLCLMGCWLFLLMVFGLDSLATGLFLAPVELGPEAVSRHAVLLWGQMGFLAVALLFHAIYVVAALLRHRGHRRHLVEVEELAEQGQRREAWQVLDEGPFAGKLGSGRPRSETLLMAIFLVLLAVPFASDLLSILISDASMSMAAHNNAMAMILLLLLPSAVSLSLLTSLGPNRRWRASTLAARLSPEPIDIEDGPARAQPTWRSLVAGLAATFLVGAPALVAGFGKGYQIVQTRVALGTEPSELLSQSVAQASSILHTGLVVAAVAAIPVAVLGAWLVTRR